jgi:glycerol uptake facilitator-like aquaporin
MIVALNDVNPKRKARFMEHTSLPQKLTAEFLGSLILVLTAISPTILGYQVLGGTPALVVLMDGLAVGLVLFVLIEILGPVSQCHINPAVTFSMMISRKMDAKTGILYIIVQFLGGFAGTLASHLMFIHEKFFTLLTISSVTRSGGAYIAEFIGTFMLVLVIRGCIHTQSKRAGMVIGLFVGGFLITTSSTMFANPQVTFARIFTFAIAGIRPLDALIFIVVQISGAFAATYFANFLFTAASGDGKK